jgi:hypothetical protein
VPNPAEATKDSLANEQRATTWANHEGPNQVTTYAQFIGMKPPTFSKAEDPLEAEAWIKAIEAKFSAFVMPCSEENKANFAALQLRGEALRWWDYFKTLFQDYAARACCHLE